MSELNRAISELSPERRALLSLRLARQRAQQDAVPRLPRTPGASVDRHRASQGQERLYFQHELAPDAVTYLLPIVLKLRGALDEEALRTALGTVVDRHEALRTGFELTPDQGLTQVVRATGEVAVGLVAEEADAADIDALVADLTTRPFDLAAAPLLRAGLWRVGGAPDTAGTERTWVFALCVHHIVVDGWSLGVLVDELMEAYTAAVEHRAAHLPELPVQYADFAAWQRERSEGAAAAAHLTHWQEVLRGAPELHLPGDRARPAEPSYRGGAVPLRLSPELTGRLTALGRSERTTLFGVLLAAYAVVLHRWSGQRDLVIGAPVAGRNRPELERLVGFFVNTLPLRLDVDGAAPFRELLRQAGARTLDGMSHQDVPYERIAQAAGGEQAAGRGGALLHTLLALRNVPFGELRLPGVEVEIVDTTTAGADLDLTLEFSPTPDGGLSGWLGYALDLYDPETAARIGEAVTSVLTAVAADGGTDVRDLPVMSEAQRERLLEMSGPAAPACPPRLLTDWFADQVAATPDAVAVIADSGDDTVPSPSLTFRELDERANRLAHWLRDTGVRTEDRVGLCLPRGLDFMVALFGVFKAGAVYVPLEPDHPAERHEQLIRDARTVRVLTLSELAGRIPAVTLPQRDTGRTPAVTPPGRDTGAEAAVEIVALDALEDQLAERPSDRPRLALTPDNAAYVLYTSGSTGQPKGVVVPHRAISNRVREMIDSLGFGPADTVLHKTPITADPSLWEILVPPLSGARQVMALPRRNTDARYVHEVLVRHRVTATDFVPSTLRPVVAEPGFAEAARTLRIAQSGGEELTAELAGRFLELAPHADLYNCYGPTESTIDVAMHRVPVPVPQPVPIGSPIAGVKLYVLDELGRIQPIGVAGELLIGGVQLARGYLDRPGQTAERYVPHPFLPGERLYRTGDRARWKADGTLEFLGRLDHQVKIRGYRVEPAEVETALRTHPAVAEATVLALPDRQGELSLAAYVTAAEGATVPGADALRRHLGRIVPTPMIPSSYTVLDVFPLTPNGKVDRAALPLPGVGGPATGVERVAPSDDVQRVLAGVWEQALGVPGIGVHDDFFDLGGHSLLATLVVSNIRQLFRIELPLHFFIEAPTVAALAVLVRAQGAEAGIDIDRVAELVLRVQRMSAAEVDAGLRA
ncbi:amino acid adenylation domain-containing protein [Streptomyces sp. ISL-36]|uniref:non-ribosomal peptide synthetase n=1 Tax=Streptomyces sp. ISL-36 TaxID=2819182 RepID=UPI001BE58A0E|nr:non-ribosomal peptide synthetase [Streptomyces sp. ISL-36]MBT2440946.1 amino acid adenylation domain-containing protein [Streptomyces sp. ISL-36]